MNKLIPWLVITVLLLACIYLAKPVLAPFIISLVLAYFLSPIAGYLAKHFKMGRTGVALILVSAITVVFFSLWALLIPIIYEQITHFIKSIPEYNIYIHQKLLPLIKEYVDKFDHNYANNIPSIVSNLFSNFFKDLVKLIDNIWQSGFMVVNILLMVILVPLVTFYFIKDWNSIAHTMESLVPINKKAPYKQLMSDINKALSAFIRGQLNVCLILAIYYSIALSVIKLDYGIFIGITTGIVSFIPFLGLLGGFVASAIVAYFKFKSWYGILAVVIVFLIGNIIEGIIYPKLIGNRLGLHPVWIIFFVLLGGSVFGFIGMLTAIPTGATMAVLIKFIMGYYYESKLYKANNK